MRIALICPYSLDLPGGVQGQVIGMAVRFATDHDVTVFAPGTITPDLLRDAGVTTVLLGRSIGVRANGSVAPIMLSLRVFARLFRALRSLRAEVCIIHEPLVPIVGLAALAGATGTRIGTFHRAGVSRGFRMLRFVAPPLLLRLDVGVVVSEEARETIRVLVNRRADRYTNIANAVDVARFVRPDAARRSNRSALFIGRHEHRKGLTVLLEAFGTLPADFSLLIGGTGPETEDLKRRYPESSQIHWLGMLNNEEVVRYLHMAELFVAPSLGGESFGVVLLEAMASGTPVIASDLAGYRLAAGDAARFVPPGDVDALARAMVDLCDDERARKAMRKRGSDRVAQFTFAQLCAQYLALVGENEL